MNRLIKRHLKYFLHFNYVVVCVCNYLPISNTVIKDQEYVDDRFLIRGPGIVTRLVPQYRLLENLYSKSERVVINLNFNKLFVNTNTTSS